MYCLNNVKFPMKWQFVVLGGGALCPSAPHWLRPCHRECNVIKMVQKFQVRTVVVPLLNV